MFPAEPVGASSCWTMVCTSATRAGLSERTITLLVRVSAATNTRMLDSTAPPCVAVPTTPSARIRFTDCATSCAAAYRSGMTIASLMPGRSMDSMILAMRFWLSA